MAKSIFYSPNLTASTRTANILAGDVNEFVVEDSQVSVFAVSSAIGVKMTLFADSDLLMDQKEIPYIGTSLDVSAHFIDQFNVAGSTRLICFLTETAGVATTDVYTAFDIQAL